MKKTHIFICILIVAVIFLLIISINFLFLDSNVKTDVVVEETNDVKYVSEFGILNGELLSRLVEKNGDWTGIPLSDGFKNKFNEKDGILGDIKYDKFEYCPDLGDDNPLKGKEYFVLTFGKKKSAYLYTYNNILTDKGTRIDDFYYDEYPLLDDEGNDVEFGHAINEDNFNDSCVELAWGYEDEKLVAVTPNFRKKYPCFLDLFIHYSPLGSNEITFDYGKSSWEEKRAYFIVDSILERKKREYEVKFNLDDKGYLDDAKVTLIKEEKYEREKLSKARDVVFYKNSDWHNLKLTDKFLSNYNQGSSVFVDIDLIDIDYKPIDFEMIESNVIQPYKYKDGKLKWFYGDYKYVENDYLDEVEFIEIDYNGTSAKEAKEIYLNSIK